MITQPNMILMLDSEEVSRHRSAVEAMESAIENGPGTYTLVRPDAEIVVPERLPWQGAEPGPEPDPEPEPEPTPEPEPQPAPDPSGRPQGIHKVINESAVLCPLDWNESDRYTRALRLVEWNDDTATMEFHCQDLSTTGGGARRPLGGTYTLLIDDVVVSEVTIDRAEQEALSHKDRIGVFRDFDISQFDDGWHVRTILSDNPEEECVNIPAYIFRGDKLPPQLWMPLWTGSHEISKFFNLVWVPAQYDPKPWPLPKREWKHFSHIPGKNEMFLEMLTGSVTGHGYRLNTNKHGIKNACTIQDYFSRDVLELDSPRLEAMDGPRGRNVVSGATFLQIGMGRFADKPDSPLMNRVYGTDARRMFKILPDGEVVTLFGVVSDDPPGYWEDPPRYRYVGDMSALPPEAPHPTELWSIVWHPQTFIIDHDADPVASEQNRQPHKYHPVSLHTDSRENRVLKAVYPKDNHEDEAVVSVFFEAEDPWGMADWDGHLIVAERGAHRVVERDWETGEVIRVLLQGRALSTVDSRRFPKRLAPLEEIRAEPIVGPEGLAVQGDWLYIGSAAMGQVKRLHKDGTLETWIPHIGGRLWYINLAVSDGTTGPESAVFVASGDVGAPNVYLPNGDRWPLMPPGSAERGRGGGGGASGLYGWKSMLSYSTAVAAGNGRILAAGVNEGIVEFSLALDSDPVIDRSLYREGDQLWSELGYYLSHGHHGDSPHGLPLPWGEHSAIDYRLKMLGHSNVST